MTEVDQKPLKVYDYRIRKKCKHGNCIYDCVIKTNDMVCGKSLCKHQRRKRDCKYCKNNHRKKNIPVADCKIHIENIDLVGQKEKIEKLILKIPQKGCLCNSERRKFLSSIVGCGQLYGCNYDKFKCSVCDKTFRYYSFVYNHIRWSISHQHML